MSDTEIDLSSKTPVDEEERKSSVSSSVFRTPLQKSKSVETSSLKSTPADPQLTETNGQSTSLRKYEENSDQKSTKEHLSNIIQDQSPNDSHQRTQSNGFFNNMMTSFSLNGSIPSSTEPEILTHRRENSGTITVSNLNSNGSTPTLKPSLPISELLSFDPKLYVNEFFADTHYRYATEKRNNDFHQIFPDIPEKDRLLDDFSCALNRDFLIQGRVYITPLHVCFNSNLLGWVTSLVINIKDILSLEKTSTAGLFPNGICINVPSEKHYFASFIARDNTFKFLEIIWHTTKELDYLTLRPEQLTLNRSHSLNDFLTGTVVTCPPSRSSYIDADSTIESAIMSVDDSFPHNKSLTNLNEENEENNYDDEDYEDEEDENDDNENLSYHGDGYYLDENAIMSDSEEKSARRVYKLKDSSKFQYDGPLYYRATEFKYDPEENKETVLAEINLNAPPGLVYQLMFSDDSPDFILTFLKQQNSSQFSEIPAFDQVSPEGQHYREYSYAKALNYPVGPKSTKCFVTENILYCAYDNYINVVNTTKTPDVPSGNSFTVKTRYMYRWRDATTCTLKISYWVDWTGSSWIKSMVDNSVKSGQTEATDSLISLIRDFVDENVEEKEMNVNINPKKTLPQSRRVSRISRKPSTLVMNSNALEERIETDNQTIVNKENFIIFLLLAILSLLLFNSLCQVRVLRKLNKLMNIKSNTVLEEIEQILNIYNDDLLD